MARNYMQDITPPGDEPEEVSNIPIHTPVPEPAARSIRNIAPTTRVRPSSVPPPPPRRLSEVRAEASRKSRKGNRTGMWVAATIGVLLLGGVGALVLFPSTVVTVTQRSHLVPFDASTQFTAYPEGATSTGTLHYSVLTESFDDSSVVEASGMQKVEEKAMGTVTVYNNYSDKPVKLIKNTRFQTLEGLIFRIPQSVDVPPKSAAGPGSIEITLFADQSGQQFNVGPIDKMTIPGLKSTPEMFDNVYAKASKAFGGGFVGDRPAVAPATLDAAKAELRGRLTERAQALVKTVPADKLAFAGLTYISFETLPPETEPGGGVRIREKATVMMPLFPNTEFAQAIGQSVSASAEGQNLTIRFSGDFSAQSAQTMSQADMGVLPINFSLTGRGQILWVIPEEELRKTLAGREQSAFKPIIATFPAIETAEARITPLWKGAFPMDPAKITIKTVELQEPL